MTKRALLAAHAAECLRPPPDCTVTEWCCENIYIPPPQTQSPGRFNIDGREYARDVIDAFGQPWVTDAVGCFGSQTGKTTILQAGVAWSIACDPSGILWVMPNLDLARSFSETRWQPIVRHSPTLLRLIPDDRHAFTKAQQQIGGALLNFVGSNSPSNIASRPARRVILDEVDKFPPADREADALTLAEMRTKSFATPQRWKVSTPTTTDGLIWQEFLKGDQRRYFIPCPRCSKLVVLIWSKQFTLFPLQGDEAQIVWDKSARREDGTWDLNRVERSARAECPHCKQFFGDEEKVKAIAKGQWRATAKAYAGFRSWHLPSLYACGTQTTFGSLAVRFLQQKRSFLGLNGFINGDLAEPMEGQDIQSERIEIVRPDIELKGEATRIMTVDCQASSPHFWYVVRSWSEGETVGIAAGSCDTWDEVRERQVAHQVQDMAVVIDSGYGAKSDAEVYRQCARFSSFEKAPGSIKPQAIGWTPSKGMPTRKTWRSKTGEQLPYYGRIVDPYAGTADGGRVEMMLIEFASDWFKDLLAAMRNPGKARETGTSWSVIRSMSTDEYWRHMDGEIKKENLNRRTGTVKYEWVKRSQRWPNHLLDCEVMQVVSAVFYGLLSVDLSGEEGNDGDTEQKRRG